MRSLSSARSCAVGLLLAFDVEIEAPVEVDATHLERDRREVVTMRLYKAGAEVDDQPFCRVAGAPASLEDKARQGLAVLGGDQQRVHDVEGRVIDREHQRVLDPRDADRLAVDSKESAPMGF